MTARDRKPSDNPQKMRDGSWYYEDRRGIDVLKQVEVRANVSVGDTVTGMARIPWGRIIKSLERCGYHVRKVRDEP